MHHFVIIIAVVIAVIESLNSFLAFLAFLPWSARLPVSRWLGRVNTEETFRHVVCLVKQTLACPWNGLFTGVTPWYQQRQKSKVRDLKRGYCSKEFRKTGHAYTDLLCLSKDKAYIHIKKARKILSDSICCLFNAKPPRCDEQDIKVLARVVHKTWLVN